MGRQSEGISPQGYTLEEACTLARSSQAKQRVLALKLLAAVLSNACPQPSHVTPVGLLQPQDMLVPGLSSQVKTSNRL